MMSNSKSPKHPAPEKLDFFDEIKESPYFQWLMENGKALPYIFGGLLLACALIFKYSTSKDSKAESNYLLAENYFEMLTRSLQGEAGDSKETLATLDKLAEITNSYPELNSRYDGLIAQLLLAMQKEKEAAPYAERTLDRTKKDNTPYHTSFSETTLLIAKGLYAEALVNAKELQKKLKADAGTDSLRSPYANLFAYNLLRIAMLEQQAGSPQGEKEAWDEWMAHFDQTENSGLENAFAALNQELKEGKYSLVEYIKARTVALSKAK